MVKGWVAALIVFIEAMGVLVLEILSVRLLAPYVGLTLETTTSIIGAVLLGISLGAGIGGVIADRTNPRYLVTGLLVTGGVLSLLTVPLVRWIGPTALDGGTIGALKVTLIALVPVAAVLSAISPAIAHWRLSDLAISGKVVGGLSMWGTAGALVGTFGTGYILVPLFPVSTSVFGVGILLVTTGVVFAATMRVLTVNAVICMVLLILAVGVSGLLLPKPCLTETSYHCVNVTPVAGYPNGRYLYLDTERNSFVDLTSDSDLGTFNYYRWIAGVIESDKPYSPLNMLVIGGGAFTLPKWLQSVRAGSRSTTLEVDSQLIQFDKQYLGLITSPSLRAVAGDARLTIRRQSTSSQDIVIGDAFSGLTVPWQLMTEQFIHEIRRVLTPNGFYVINMIDFHPLSLLRAEIATIKTQFTNVRLITKADSNGKPAGGNVIILASNFSLPKSNPKSLVGGGITYNDEQTIHVEGDPPILTDNYAPVEQLQTR